MTNRRNFIGWLAGLFTVGTTGSASANKPVTIEIKWGSYHSGEFWVHYMVVDGLKYASLYWLEPYPNKNKDPNKNKENPFGVRWVGGNIKDGNQWSEVRFAALESALQYAEHKVLSYLTYQYQIPFDKIELKVDRTAVLEGIREEMNSFYNCERIQKESDERMEREFGFKMKSDDKAN